MVGLFGQKISFFVAREPHMGWDIAEGDKFSAGVEVTKRIAVSSETEDA